MIATILAALADVDAVGAFIYGSVAHGTATATSDLDVMVLLRRDLGDIEREAIRERFRELQVELGFWPDPLHPVELFTVTSAAQALQAGEPDEDQREIRKALRDRKIVVLDSSELNALFAISGGSR